MSKISEELAELCKAKRVQFHLNSNKSGRFSVYDEPSGKVLSLHGTSLEADRARPSLRQVVRFEGPI